MYQFDTLHFSGIGGISAERLSEFIMYNYTISGCRARSGLSKEQGVLLGLSR